MTLAYDRDGIALYHGDCREILPALAFDAIASDPPYGIGFEKKDTGRPVKGRRSLRRHAGPIVGDGEHFDPSHLLAWPCVLFGANHYYARLPDGGTFHAWDKRAHSTLDDSFSDAEFIWTSWRCKSRIVSHLWKGVLRASERNDRKHHVSQKPVAVMMQLLDWFFSPGLVVCDPYAGSGSTLVAASKMGRRAIGVEVDARCIPIIIRRLESAEAPLLRGQCP